MKPLLSLCIPTNGIIEWVFPVLDSIYSQGVDNALFEVVLTDNGSNGDFKSEIRKHMAAHNNLIYAETAVQSFLNEIESYKRARGKLIKFVNHRTKLVPGALERLIEFARQNEKDKSIIYFSNGVLNLSKRKHTYTSFDQFVNALSYGYSWSTGMFNTLEFVMGKGLEMAKRVEVVPYNDEYKDRWDRFVIEQSSNGTILQTRKFLDYHPKERFVDSSLLFLNGTNIIAVMPANSVKETKLVSHQGSTFGGLVINKRCCKISYLEQILEVLNKYANEKKIDEIYLKQTGSIFQSETTDLIDYFLFRDGYMCSQEVGFYIVYEDYPEDIISAFSSSRRRDYRYSLKNGFSFRELNSNVEIEAFYNVLCDNYTKFGKSPIHTINELIEFKTMRMRNETGFYGVYLANEMIAGGMVFKFKKDVMHTQYLAVHQDRKDLFANEFLYVNLIKTAKEKGFKKLSFGTSTLAGGRILNTPLALFKEGFGTRAYVNRTYHKVFS